MKEPSVSVVIGAYNCGKFIQETIYSVVNQTLKDWELIIVDDCSNDDTYEKVKTIDDERIRIIRLSKNSGLPAVPRNEGIRASKGEFIAFLDHDDIWFPDKLSTQLEYLRNNSDISLVTSSVKIKSADKMYNDKIATANGRVWSEHIYSQLLNYNFVPSSSVMVRACIFDDIGFFDENPEIVAAEDWDLWLRIARSYKIAVIPKILGIYIMHSFNLSADDRTLQKALNVIDKHFEKGWITQKQANRARASFYFREGWDCIDKNIRKSRTLFYDALRIGRENFKVSFLAIIALFLSWFPFACNLIKRKALDRKAVGLLSNFRSLYSQRKAGNIRFIYERKKDV